MLKRIFSRSLQSGYCTRVCLEQLFRRRKFAVWRRNDCLEITVPGSSVRTSKATEKARSPLSCLTSSPTISESLHSFITYLTHHTLDSCKNRHPPNRRHDQVKPWRHDRQSDPPPPFSELLELKSSSNREDVKDSWRVQDIWNNWILGNHPFFCIACYFKMLKRTSEDNSSYESVFFWGRPRLSSASPFASRLTSSMSRRKKAACGHHSQSQHCTHSHSHSDFFSSSPFFTFSGANNLIQTFSCFTYMNDLEKMNHPVWIYAGLDVLSLND